ncbi:MAG: restriction endonuclease [Bacillota bacterium]
MARRKSKAKQEEEFMQAILGLAALGGFSGGYYLTKSWKVGLIGAAIMMGLVIAFLIAQRQHRSDQLRKSGIAEIDRMEGVQFEHYLAELFKSQGYSVKVTRASGDYGADLVIQKGGRKIVVQAKRFSKNIGIEAVQQIYGAKTYYNSAEAWVVSNRDYTVAARNLAKSNGVRLVNRDELIQMILGMNPNVLPQPKQIIAAYPAKARVCNKCGQPMVLRKGARGEFYGCSSYPKCRNIKAV